MATIRVAKSNKNIAKVLISFISNNKFDKFHHMENNWTLKLPFIVYPTQPLFV